jgi:hypothetical protein
VKPNPKRLIELFVGNKENFIFWENGWKRRFFPLTKTTVEKHLNFQIAVGSYPIYVENGIPYCKWICFDIDSHQRVSEEVIKDIMKTYEPELAKICLEKLKYEYSKKTDLKLKEKQKEFVSSVFDNSFSVLGVGNQHLLLENSGGGFHLWFFLKNKTLLEDVGKYVYCVKEDFKNYYLATIPDAETPEIYPKQYSLDKLDKGLGNAVRLPFGFNSNKGVKSEILKGNIESVEQYDLHDLVKNVEVKEEKTNGNNGLEKPLTLYEGFPIDESWHFWLEYPLKPCVKRFIEGKVQCHGLGGNRGHVFRMAVAHECEYYGVPFETIVKAFSNQIDYEESKTREQLKSILNGRFKDARYSCNKIKQLGFCHNCGEKIYK